MNKKKDYDRKVDIWSFGGNEEYSLSIIKTIKMERETE